MCEGSGRKWSPSNAKLCCSRSGGNLCFVCVRVCLGVVVLWCGVSELCFCGGVLVLVVLVVFPVVWCCEVFVVYFVVCALSY
jgi:hypothetical protein